MVTKTDLKRLLSKGLTGREAAQLVLQDSWEVDHKRDGFLSKADIQRIKNGLRTQADIQEYNRLIHVYQLVDYTLKDARIMALEAIQALLMASKELDVYWLEDRIRWTMLAGLPAIVTQKQYDELKAKQKELKLKWLSSIEEIIGDIGQKLAPELEEEAAEADEEGYYYDFGDWLAEHRPEVYKQAVQILIEHVREDRLRPVQLRPEQRQALLSVNRQLDEIQTEKEQNISKPLPEEWHQLWAKKQELLWAFYEAGKQQFGQENRSELLRLLERLLAVCETDSSLTEEESDALGFAYCSGADLYQIGLIEWVDGYVANFDEETAARPAGRMQASRVAILQDPGPSDLDERGYYKDPGYLESLSGYEGRNEEDRSKTRGFSIPELLEALHKLASEKIKSFLAIQASVEAVSQTVGVQFTEDLEQWYEELQANVGIYNSRLEPLHEHHGLPHYLGMPKLEELKIGRLKPTAKSLRYYRERMAIALGDDWIREAFKILDFRPSETGTLAERMIKDIRQAKQQLGLDEEEEESDGQEA